MLHRTRYLTFILLLGVFVYGAFINVPFGVGLLQGIGFPMHLGVFLCFLVLAYHIFRPTIETEIRSWSWREPLFLVGAAIFLLTREAYGYKVLMDDPVVWSTALSLYLTGAPTTPDAGIWIAGEYYLFGGYLDKRPILFQSLLAAIHHLTGFRFINGFLLNSFVSICLILSLFTIAKRIHPLGGYLAVMVWVGIPIVAQNATGASFEMLNAFLILTLLAGLIHHLGTPSRSGWNFLVLNCVLLAFTRYESIIYSLVLPFVFLLTWQRTRSLDHYFTWAVAFAPVLYLMPVALNRFVGLNLDIWQLPEHLEKPFGLHFLNENLLDALKFFTDVSTAYSNSIVAFFFGILGLSMLLAHCAPKKLPHELRTYALSLGAIAIPFAVTFSVLMFYWWGQLSKSEVSRLALPSYLLACAVIPFILRLAPQQRARLVEWTVFVLAFTGIAFSSLPKMARGDYRAANESNYTAVATHQLLEQIDPKRDLVIYRSAIVPIAKRYNATRSERIRRKPENLALHYKAETFQDVFIIRLFIRVHPLGAWEPYFPEDRLDSWFELETVESLFITPESHIRLERITGLTPALEEKAAAKFPTLWDRPEDTPFDRATFLQNMP